MGAIMMRMPTSIQRKLAKLIGYDLALYWTPGKLQTVADALSRSPVWGPEDQRDILACSVRVAQTNSVDQEATIDKAIKALGDDAKSEKEYHDAYLALKAKKELIDLPRDHAAQKYKENWSFMAVEPDMPNLMLYMGRIMVPERAKARVKETLHLAHLGETKTLALARSLYQWPGMVKELKRMVWECKLCERYRISKPAEPLLQTLDA